MFSQEDFMQPCSVSNNYMPLGHMQHTAEELNDSAVGTVKELYYCRYCAKAFLNIVQRTSHETFHEQQKFPCVLCGRTFGSTQKLRRHNDAIHIKTRHTCPGCNKSFTQRENLVRHQKCSCPGSLHSINSPTS